MSKAFERLPGFRDFYPEPLPHPEVASADLRRHIFDTWRAVARRYGFREYDGPPLEPLELYTAKSGAEIVAQLYHFVDKGGREVALRPEMTPTLARLVAAHHRAYKKPIKWFAIPQLFRYERQQKGRLREHFQFNADLIGEADPAADAELIALLIDTLLALGLQQQDFVIRLSSRNAWRDFYQRAGGAPEREYEFFQIIDKLERETPETSAAKLQALGFSLPQVQEFIQRGEPTPELQGILANLRARGREAFVKVDYAVIRGLAYYTGPVFEAFDRQGEFRAIAGGGRYDNLIRLISGGKVDLPALGFGMGDVVVAELMKARRRLPALHAPVDVVCVIEDEQFREPSLRLVQALRDLNQSVEFSLTPAKPDKQWKRATELGAKFGVTVRPQPNGEVMAHWKNLLTRQEQILPLGVWPAD
ncbi:MAG: ATP phosphoribosyltransferase regulatory subunit [Verrucomicrobiae bacterium]|nr:ATP phosphoribosyltransferase regulatory subunit [Verrucomicrobiae bacterium]